MPARGAVSIRKSSAGPGRRRRQLTLLVLLCVVGVATAGCTSGADDTPAPGSSSSPVNTAGTSTSEESAGSTTSVAAPTGGSTSVPGPAPDYAGGVSAAVERVMKEDGTPGAVVLVRSPAGDWTSAFGVRSLDDPAPVQTGDVFRLANMTSVMTATVILQLEEQGLLSLQDPISKYVDGVPNGDQISLRALGSYRSGLFDYEQDETFQARYAQDPGRNWTPQEVLDLAFAHPSETPGTESYSTTNFVLLGLIIEKVTGKPAAQAFGTGLFEPLGLTRIGLAGDATLPDPHADGYSWAENPFADPFLTDEQRQAAAAGTLSPKNRTADNPTWAFTGGAAYSDAGSLADLFTGMVSGSLLDADSREERIAWMNTMGPVDDTASVHYGFGLARYGQYLFYSGSMPGYSALAAIAPDTGTTIVVLASLGSAPDGGSPVGGIFHAIADAVEPVNVPGA